MWAGVDVGGHGLEEGWSDGGTLAREGNQLIS